MPNIDLTTIVIALVAAVPGVLAFVAQLRKDKSEDAQARADDHREEMSAIADSARQLIEPLQNRIRDLECETVDLRKQKSELFDQVNQVADKFASDVAALRSQVVSLRRELSDRDAYIAELLAGIERLDHQIRALNGTPVWAPTFRARTDE